MRLHARMPSITSTPSIRAGRDRRSRRPDAHERPPPAPPPRPGRSRRRIHAPRVRAQPTHDLGFVVDDEHTGHRPTPAEGPATAPVDASVGTASGKATTIVRPPPGVSSGVRVPPIASTNRAPPRDRDRRRRRPRGRRAAGRARRPAGDPRPGCRTPVDHPQFDPTSGRRSEDTDRGAPRLNDRAFATRFADGPLEQGSVDVDPRQVLGDVDLDVVSSTRRLASARGPRRARPCSG